MTISGVVKVTISGMKVTISSVKVSISNIGPVIFTVIMSYSMYSMKMDISD